MHSPRRGFALIYQLMISGILLLLVGALLTVCQEQLFVSRLSIEQNRALSAAEAGLAATIAELERNNAWKAGWSERALPGGSGAVYSLRFAQIGSPAGPTDSVNNLAGVAAADSYRGALTVPPHNAYLIVTGRSGSTTRTIEAYVVGGKGLLSDAAIAGTGKISLRGNLLVDGYNSLRDLSNTPAGIFSSRVGPGAVSWAPLLSGDTARISGQVSSCSLDPAAIRFAGTRNTDFFYQAKQLGARSKPFPTFDILGLIAAQAVHPGPPLPALGVCTLTASDNYYGGDRTIDGDLILQNGARLFVSGNLTVNGSISGDGVVVVGGQTRFYGNSEIDGDPSKFVSLLSDGTVVLQGFDGTAYLKALAASQPPNPATPRGQEAGELWQDIGDALAWLQANVTSPDRSSWSDSPSLDTQIDERQAVLGPGLDNWANYPQHTPDIPSLPNRPLRNSLGALAGKLPASGATAGFLRAKLQHIQDLFRCCSLNRDQVLLHSGPTLAGPLLDIVDHYVQGTWNPASDGGIFDSAETLRTAFWSDPLMTPAEQAKTEQVLNQVARQVDQLSYDRIGAAQFRGLVYTHGGILVSNEMNVLGTLIAAGERRVAPLTVAGQTIAPGDIMLQNDSRFTYVQDMFDNGVANLASLGNLGVQTWCAR